MYIKNNNQNVEREKNGLRKKLKLDNFGKDIFVKKSKISLWCLSKIINSEIHPVNRKLII